MPVLLSALAVPGAGQIRNGEVAKGIALVVASLGLFGILFVRILADLWPVIVAPHDLTTLVPDVNSAVTRALSGHGLLVALLVVVWVYAVADAFWVARGRAAAAELQKIG